MTVTIVTAVPPLKAVIWSRNGQTLFGSRYSDGNTNTPSLSINNITASDDGKPFIRMSGNNVAGIGSTVNLEGLITSKPNIRNTIWKRAYQNTSVVIDFTNGSKFGRSGTLFHPILTITNLQRADEGLYLCAASHDFSEGVGKISVSIGVVPLVSREETDYQGTVGNDIQLNCSYDSNPQAMFLYWLKNGTRINLDLQREKYTKSNVSYPDLTIYNVQLNDTGIYVCCVGNVIGVGCSAYIKLLIKDTKEETSIDLYPVIIGTVAGLIIFVLACICFIKVEGNCNENRDSDHVYKTLSIYNAIYDYSVTTDARKSSHCYEDIDILNKDV
ncbi:unnamed protein product [Mytilus edulis]|uniref:Ig-like domain-containing protein n=1 Tax=Mytilus edulis TaxID=6550 RepID=A0A8S3PV25_MYTED|nr:unnamed protein product [Mytilus edulis]